jgi:hypothetical protein
MFIMHRMMFFAVPSTAEPRRRMMQLAFPALPETPMSAIHAHIDSLERYAARSGARLARAELPESVHGRLVEGRIILCARLSPEQEFLALVHELTHWLAHRFVGETPTGLSRTVYEYEAEAVEALVMSRLGLAAPDDESLPTDGLLSSSFARVMATSRRICQALGLEPD